MQPKTIKLLEDIRDAAAFVLDVRHGQTLADYEQNRIFRQAVERNFEIIGEAVHRLSRIDGETVERITDYRRIIAFRNVLSHGYDMVTHEEVWRVIEHQLPVLLNEV